jgi:hypothetical protein
VASLYSPELRRADEPDVSLGLALMIAATRKR